MQKISFIEIMKDIIKNLKGFFVATVLLSICIDKGWLPYFQYKQFSINFNEFWNIFSCFCCSLPVVTLIRALLGKYYVLVVKGELN